MRHVTPLTALACLALVVGCEPAEEGAQGQRHEELLEADGTPRGSGLDLDEQDEERAGPIYGTLRAGDGTAVSGANVCVLNTRICTTSDRFGNYKLSGLIAEVSEALFIIAPRHVPVVVPVEMGAELSRRQDVQLPRGDAFMRSETGAVRLVTRVILGRDDAPVEGRWYLAGGNGDMPRGAGRPNASIKEVPPGTYEASFRARGGAVCSPANGWSTEKRGVVALPVLQGAVTIVQQRCIVPSTRPVDAPTDAPAPRQQAAFDVAQPR